MKVAFTICTNNYLAQAFALKYSFQIYHPSDEFYIILIDRPVNLPSCIPIELTKNIISIENIEPSVASMSHSYNIVELSTAVKPTAFLWFLKEKSYAESFIFLDPDLYFYNSLDFFDKFPERYKAFLTPHLLVPIPYDHEQPEDNTFLKYGIYNLGFLYVRNHKTIIPFLEWWKNHTYTRGFNNLEKGQFVDQLPMNLAPIFFDFFFILSHSGINVAPWNYQERHISITNHQYMVNGIDKLIFIHFSNFSPEFPGQISKYNWHTRNNLFDNKILADLYLSYAEKLNELGYGYLSEIKSVYLKPEEKLHLRIKFKKCIRRWVQFNG